MPEIYKHPPLRGKRTHQSVGLIQKRNQSNSLKLSRGESSEKEKCERVAFVSIQPRIYYTH
jgi:hypothetical protein